MSESDCSTFNDGEQFARKSARRTVSPRGEWGWAWRPLDGEKEEEGASERGKKKVGRALERRPEREREREM